VCGGVLGSGEVQRGRTGTQLTFLCPLLGLETERHTSPTASQDTLAPGPAPPEPAGSEGQGKRREMTLSHASVVLFCWEGLLEPCVISTKKPVTPAMFRWPGEESSYS
jgi:hypothetical protein